MSTKNSLKAYKGDIDITFNGTNGSIRLGAVQIVYVMVEEDYLNNIIPIIYLSINANNELYNDIIQQREDATFSVNIGSYNASNGNYGSATHSISGEYKYVPATTNADYGEMLNQTKHLKNIGTNSKGKNVFEYRTDPLMDTSYRTIDIGLVSTEQTEMMRKPFNGIRDNTTTSEVIESEVMSHFENHYMQALDNDVEYNIEELGDPLIMTPASNIYDFLENLYKVDAFYNSPFRIFLDCHNKFYLLSRSKTESESVIIKITDVEDDISIYDGIGYVNGATTVYVNQINVRYTSDQSITHIVNQVTAYNDESVESASYGLENNGEGRTQYARTNYGNTVKNQYDSDAAVEIIKNHIDGSQFTPDKQYYIDNTGEYSKFNGSYILAYKKVYFKSVDGNYLLTCNLGFTPTSENTSSHSSINRGKASSSTATKTTTASNATNDTNRNDSTKQKNNSSNTRTRSEETAKNYKQVTGGRYTQ